MGLGGIGSEVVRRLAVFGPNIIGVDPKVESAPPGAAELARPEQLTDLLPEAHAVIICAPQTPETTGLFDAAMFRRMRRDALFINIGRGKIVQLAALEQALGEGWIAGAGLDVFETEPLPAEEPALADGECHRHAAHRGCRAAHGGAPPARRPGQCPSLRRGRTTGNRRR